MMSMKVLIRWNYKGVCVHINKILRSTQHWVVAEMPLCRDRPGSDIHQCPICYPPASVQPIPESTRRRMMAWLVIAWSFRRCIVAYLRSGAIWHILWQASLEFLPAFEPLCCLRNIPWLGMLNSTPPGLSVHTRAKEDALTTHLLQDGKEWPGIIRDHIFCFLSQSHMGFFSLSL